MSRDDSDEAYVVGLCHQVLGATALAQHRFDWLLGDPGAGGRRARLPVDAYWPGHRLVLEYRERQHEEPTPFFRQAPQDDGQRSPPRRAAGPL
ncbi:hypothetical protein [Streptomyces sp. NRRL F-2580]|uniref:hypothetical protein n=1 Tax=Streptomyces sp. NRRL F-2580 TaxID=1463841 RepID=UPI001F39EED8|nr:hypothetical protein [Streptomyces sp. NRRL F-2580]